VVILGDEEVEQLLEWVLVSPGLEQEVVHDKQLVLDWQRLAHLLQELKVLGEGEPVHDL
jgi:hypothetical protein